MLKINLSRDREEIPGEETVSGNYSDGPEQEIIFPKSKPEPETASGTLVFPVTEPSEHSEAAVEAPAAEAVELEKRRRDKDQRGKVPLSLRETGIPDEIRAVMQAAKPPVEEKKGFSIVRGGRLRFITIAAAVMLTLAAGYFAWTRRDVIAAHIPSWPMLKIAAREKAKPSPALLPGKTAAPADTTAKPAPSAPDATPPPEAPAGSDPVLSSMAGISDATPPRVWLTAASARSDGVYELKGMSFSHEAMRSFVATLERRGTIASRNIPVETKNADTVYTFSLSGKLKNLRVTEILDALPANRLYALGDSLRVMPKDAGILVVRLPKAGKAYAESEFPFELEGAYSVLQKTLERFLFNRGIVIDRISIRPASSGKQYSRVRVSFSLRTISSI